MAKAVTLFNHLIADSADYINWAFSLGNGRTGMMQNDCLYKFWQWNAYNERMKEIDKESYEASNRRFEEKYALFTQIINNRN